MALRIAASVYALLKGFEHSFCGLQVLEYFETWHSLNASSLLLTTPDPEQLKNQLQSGDFLLAALMASRCSNEQIFAKLPRQGR